MAEDDHKVTLNVYDLSQGLARQISMTFLGKAIDGIWHTGIVVYGNEYYFGGGIQHDPAGRTPYGTPIKVIDLGVTHVPQDVFEQYLHDISPRYTAETYSLLTHNCNNFTNEVAQFLVGATIPDYILGLPAEVMNSPMAALILPMIQNLEATLRAGAVPQAPQFSSAAATTAVNTSSDDGLGSTINITVKVPNDEALPEVTKSHEPRTANTSIPPAVKPAEAVKVLTANGIADPLGDARSQLQEEISVEFEKIMRTGTLRASEAATLATRRVMQKYKNINFVAENEGTGTA